MDTESSTPDRQHLAFAYLRDRARRAHAEGDGTLVNSLCALALSQAKESAKKNQLQLGLPDLKWAFILPLFWLIDDYMFRAVDDALKLAFKPSTQQESLLKLLRAYLFLVHEPLANIDEQVSILTEMTFETFGEGNQCEDLVLLTHSIELVWYRDSNEGRWQKLADDWIKRAPTWCKTVIEKLKLRLALQTRLTAPNMNFPPVTAAEASNVPDELRLGELWIFAINCEWDRLDATIKRLSAVTSPKSHVALLLFDYHHWNRWHGDKGEDQEIGLTRRRLFTASAPLLLFNDTRESRLAESLGRLFRYGQVGKAYLRFQVFQLAMLCELSALRLWDWAAWQEANMMQSEAYLEAARWDSHSVDMASCGILLAVRSMSYEPEEKDALSRMALSRLEFADEKVLVKLVDGLMASYPWQYYQVYEALVDLSDLIPASQWSSVAKWGMEFSEAIRKERTAGSTLYPFLYLTEIIRYAEPGLAIWNPLLPELLEMVRSPFNWSSSSGRLINAWLRNAPEDAAKALGLAMLAVSTTDPNLRGQRFRLLRGAEKTRPGLKGAFTPELRKLASSALELVSLSDVTEPELRTQAKVSVKQAIEDAVKQLTPPPGTKASPFGAIPYMETDAIEWTKDDLPLLDQLTTAVENPAVATRDVSQLLSCIQLLVHCGPRSFAEYALPRFEAWVEHPPVGRESFGRPGGPFSIVQYGDSSLSQIPVMIGWIGFQLLFKLGDPVAPVLAKWIHNSVLNPEAAGIPIMIYVGIPAAIRLPSASRIDLLSACQGLLAHLLLRHRSEPEQGGALAEALNYLGQLMRKQDHPLVQWDSESAQQSLELLVPKFSLALIEASKSTNADVRAAVARFLRNLEEWMELPPTLRQILEKLTTDNRARVRFQARPRTQAAG